MTAGGETMGFAHRVERLTAGLERPLLVSALANIRYLTGFTGSNAFVLATPDGLTFITDGRYAEVASGLIEHLPGAELMVYNNQLHRHLASAIGSADVVDLEAAHVTWDFVTALQSETSAELVATTDVVERFRRVKDGDEVAALAAAAAAGDAAFAALPGLLDAASTEAELGDGLISTMKSRRAERAGWEPIVAVGPNAARPHHRAGTGSVDAPGILLLDYGCVVGGYHSDMTRTVWMGGEPDDEARRVHAAVLASNEAGIAAVRPGAVAGDVDEACRAVLRSHGYEEFFVHSTGHGVGLDIHEAPWVRRGSEDVLEPGNVVTIEPGVYLPGRFGVRIEDMVLVTEDGHQVLTASPKEIQPA